MAYYVLPERQYTATVPPGIATEAKQDDIISELQSLNANVTEAVATEAKQDDIITELQALNTNVTEAVATEAKQDDIITELQTLNSVTATEAKQDDIITAIGDVETAVNAVAANTLLGVVDEIDATPLLNLSLTNIPKSSGNPVQVVASLAAAVKKIITVEDIGEYIGLYTGAALSEVLYCILPLGGGEVSVNIPAATRISLKHLEDTDLTSGFMAINFIG